MEVGEPIQVFTLTMAEAETLDRSRRLTPADREHLVRILRQMTGETAKTTGDGGEHHTDAQRGATR
jgi:hypothetical protein